MELEGQDFHAKVSDAYLKIAEEHPERFVVIDADRPQAEVFESVKEALGRVLKDRRGRRPFAPDGSGRTGRVASPRERRPRSGARAGCRHGVPDRRCRASAPRLRVRGAGGLRQVASPRGRSPPRSCARTAAAARAGRAGSRSTITTPTCSWWSPRAETSTWTPIREEVWTPAYRDRVPSPGRKVFVIREADRLSPAAADTLLKVLEEPPADSVLLLMSARAHELPETVLSRCHVVTFTALSETFVVDVLVGRGGGRDAGAPGRAARGREPGPRAAPGDRGRRTAVPRGGRARRRARLGGSTGALEAADVVLAAAAEYKKGLKSARSRT